MFRIRRRYEFTARFARVAEIAEELFYNFLLTRSHFARAKLSHGMEGRKLRAHALRTIR
jgi:hypothetical protein